MLPTAILDREVPEQKTISSRPLEAMVRRTTGRGAIGYESLRGVIDSVV